MLDCFLGGGATAVAAHQLGRNFIGCDMGDEWVEATLARLHGPAQMTLDEMAA